MDSSTVVHFTKKINIPSIKRNGLQPVKPWIPEHYNYFEKKVIYTVPFLGKHETIKAGADHIYFQTKYKHKLIRYIEMCEEGFDINDYAKVIDELRKIPMDLSDYGILKFDAEKVFMDINHGQFAGEHWNPDFPQKFSHEMQPLKILDKTVLWDSISVIGECSPVIKNGDLHDIKIKMY